MTTAPITALKTRHGRLHLAGIVAPLAAHPAVLAWDIKNEADRDAAFNTPARNEAWLRHMAAEVRRHDPHHLITVGWSTPQAAAAAPDDFVDLVSFHYYGAAADYAAALAALHTAVGDKPLLLSEYGQSTWRWLWPAGYLEAQQAGHIAAIRAANTRGTAGEVVWALYDFTTVPLAEFRFPGKKPPRRTWASCAPTAAPSPPRRCWPATTDSRNNRQPSCSVRGTAAYGAWSVPLHPSLPKY